MAWCLLIASRTGKRSAEATGPGILDICSPCSRTWLAVGSTRTNYLISSEMSPGAVNMLILQNSLQELAAAGGPAVAIDAAWDAIACQMFSVVAYWTMCAPPLSRLSSHLPQDPHSGPRLADQWSL
jgi:hypothetical protein